MTTTKPRKATVPADHVITADHLKNRRVCGGCSADIVWNGRTWRPIATRNDGAVMMGVPFCGDSHGAHNPR